MATFVPVDDQAPATDSPTEVPQAAADGMDGAVRKVKATQHGITKAVDMYTAKLESSLTTDVNFEGTTVILCWI